MEYVVPGLVTLFFVFLAAFAFNEAEHTRKERRRGR